ncbi:MAG TPA: TolC family protein, partial [Prolixibacteraceae bacterium]|nr:TolC family protein [Prolixibacteraceae bacterium]
MRTFFLLIIVFGMGATSLAQHTYKLDEYRKLVVSHYPKLNNKQINQDISQLKTENIRNAYLPEIILNGQATYQSDVTSIDLPETLTSMGFDIEGVSNDQYKAYLDVKQTIWDGGITKAQREMEALNLDGEQQKIDIEVHQLKCIADTYFFNVLLVRKSLEVLKLQNEVLAKQLERLQKSLQQGVVTQKDVLEF